MTKDHPMTLSPKQIAEIEGLVVKLRRTIGGSYGAARRWYHNPDGPEAATALETLILAAKGCDRLKAENERLREAVLEVVNATRAYLPPDGIDAQECINRVLAATDNPTINPIILEVENDRT